VRRAVRALRLFPALLLFTGAASGYYHYIHYNAASGWTPLYEKFDLNALPGKTVGFFIEEPSNMNLHVTDSVTGLISQIRFGAQAWNKVATSELRVAYGGIAPRGTDHRAPAIEVLFEELPPGYVAMGGPRVLASPNGSFVPIQVSQVILNRDLSTRPSYSEAFFGTFVHEFGHALGLQHTLTSAAMATEITRSISKARPLAADDVAGLSVLYPTPAFAAATGAISGRVLVEGAPAALASVVAIAPNGAVVSSLTHPDGTYRIAGIPPGRYFVYAHPLPPALQWKGEVTPANVNFPVDSEGNALTDAPVFEAQFYPGVRDEVQAHAVAVSAGGNLGEINFNAPRRASVTLHSATTYGYSAARLALKAGYLYPEGPYQFVIATGTGLMANGSPVSGLSARVLNGAVLPVKTYPQSDAYIQMDVDPQSFLFANEGPRHLVFRTAADTYLLPAAFYQVRTGPPSITAVTPVLGGEGRSTVAITGTQLGSATRVLFDGVPGETRGLDETGNLIVVPPPANPAHIARVVALNPDGQSSLFMGAEPPVYAYGGEAPVVALAVTPATLPAGVESTVTIEVTGGQLGSAVSAAFGNAGVVVRRLWVTGPTTLLANVVTSSTAAGVVTGLTVANGLQSFTAPAIFTVGEAQPGLLSLNTATILNVGTEPERLYSGATVRAGVYGIAPMTAGTPVAVYVNGARVPTGVAGETSVLFIVQGGLPAGPASVVVQVNGVSSLPVTINLEAVPPLIGSVLVNGLALTGETVLKAGDVVALVVSNLGPADLLPESVSLKFGSADVRPAGLVAVEGVHRVTFAVPAGLAAGAHALTIGAGGRVSPHVLLRVN
jgi:hypothetical protein